MTGIIFATYPISSGVGERWGKMHKGNDYACPVGTSVQSVTNGIVIFTGYEPNGFGNYIKIKDASGNIHYYGHLSKITIKSGATVSAGEEIGKSGNTGRSTGAHVHYQVISKNGSVLNPNYFINNTSVSNPIENETIMDNVSLLTDNSTVQKISNGILRTGAIAIIILFLLIVGIVGFMKAFGISANPVKISNLKEVVK